VKRVIWYGKGKLFTVVDLKYITLEVCVGVSGMICNRDYIRRNMLFHLVILESTTSTLDTLISVIIYDMLSLLRK
jgi:hypothetical protein